MSHEWCQLNILYELPNYVMEKYCQIYDREFYVFLVPSLNHDFFCEISRSKELNIKYAWHFHFIYLNRRFCCEWSSNMTHCKSFTTYGNHSIRIFIWLKWTDNCHYTHSINKSQFTTNIWILEVWNRYQEWMLINSLCLNDGNFDTAYG